MYLYVTLFDVNIIECALSNFICDFVSGHCVGECSNTYTFMLVLFSLM